MKNLEPNNTGQYQKAGEERVQKTQYHKRACNNAGMLRAQHIIDWRHFTAMVLVSANIPCQ